MVSICPWVWLGEPGVRPNTIALASVPIWDCLKNVNRLIFLNALVPPPPSMHMFIFVRGTNVEELRRIVLLFQGERLSFIGHESTARALNEMLGVNVPVNRGLYEPRPGDLAVIARVKGRPQGEIQVTPEQLELLLAWYLVP